jgi:hypothetical protein
LSAQSLAAASLSLRKVTWISTCASIGISATWSALIANYCLPAQN